ncbi:hypothetical protein ACS0TY_000148 [Phlomoides rotata]
MATFVQQMILYAAAAALSYLVRKHMDPNREASKKAMERRMETAKRYGRPSVETNTYEDIIACDVVSPDDIDVTFDSIGGLGPIKQALYELVILSLRRPDLFSQGKLLSPQKGVLLYGPPGTGKTMLAKAIAKQSGAVFINVRISNLMSKWFGDAQKLVTAVFTLANKLQPAIIFIDEVDKNARVMVLAATNRPFELDEAILRRFPQSFKIGLPNRKEGAAILRVILKDEKVEDGIDSDHLAGLCDGYSGSDLLGLCKTAALFPIRDLLNDEKTGNSSQEPRLLSQLDLEKAVATTTKTDVAAYEYMLSNSRLSGLSRHRGSEDHDCPW